MKSVVDISSYDLAYRVSPEAGELSILFTASYIVSYLQLQASEQIMMEQNGNTWLAGVKSAQPQLSHRGKCL